MNSAIDSMGKNGSPAAAASNYNDLSALQNISRLGRKNSAAGMEAVAKQFESLFTGMMMKSMRDANKAFEDGNIGHGQESEFYRDMYDKQLALSLSQGKGIGLAEVLTKQFRMQYSRPAAVSGNGQLSTERASGSGLSLHGAAQPVREIGETTRNIEPLDRAARMERGFSLPGAAVSALKTAMDNRALQDAVALDVEVVSDGIANSAHANWGNSVQVSTPDTRQSFSPIANTDNGGDGRFESQQDFVDTLMPLFQRYAEPLGLDPRALLSQAALETGWGKHMMRCADGSNTCNLFGIKAGSSWEGAIAKVSTTEYSDGIPVKTVASFRAYDNYAESVRDYVHMMAMNPRYRSAIIKGGNPVGYFSELQKAGYATDPAYAKKMFSIYKSPVLAQLDNPASRTHVQDVARNTDASATAGRS